MEAFLNYLFVRQFTKNVQLDADLDEHIKDALVEMFADVTHLTDAELDEGLVAYQEYEKEHRGAVYLVDNLLRVFDGSL